MGDGGGDALTPQMALAAARPPLEALGARSGRATGDFVGYMGLEEAGGEELAHGGRLEQEPHHDRLIFLMFTDLDEMVFTLVRLQHPPRDEHWGRVPHEVVPTRSDLRRPTYSSTGYFQNLRDRQPS